MINIADHLHDLGIEKGFLNETQNAVTRKVKSRREAPSSSRPYVQGSEKVAGWLQGHEASGREWKYQAILL